jgi:hypothetical protein
MAFEAFQTQVECLINVHLRLLAMFSLLQIGLGLFVFTAGETICCQ